MPRDPRRCWLLRAGASCSSQGGGGKLSKPADEAGRAAWSKEGKGKGYFLILRVSHANSQGLLASLTTYELAQSGRGALLQAGRKEMGRAREIPQLERSIETSKHGGITPQPSLCCPKPPLRPSSQNPLCIHPESPDPFPPQPLAQAAPPCPHLGRNRACTH